MTDNIVQDIVVPVLGAGGGGSFIAEEASARSTVTQILSVDDVAEVILFAQDQVTSSGITILTNNQFQMASPGDYVARCNYHMTRQSGTGFIRHFVWYERDTGGGYAAVTNSTTLESMNSNDAPEIHPVTKALLFFTTTAINEKIRMKHQTDVAARNVGIEATASGGSVPNGVASIDITVIRLA